MGAIMFESLVNQVAEQLNKRNWTVTTAESCTGGGIAYALTSVAGSSVWFKAGLVTYSNENKTSLLNVLPTTLDTQGAVSEAVVEEMATGAALRALDDCAMAVSGVAGPDGGTAEKPVGTVCFGWTVGGVVSSETHLLSGDRKAVREQTIEIALKGLLHRIENYA